MDQVISLQHQVGKGAGRRPPGFFDRGRRHPENDAAGLGELSAQLRVEVVRDSLQIANLATEHAIEGTRSTEQW